MRKKSKIIYGAIISVSLLIMILLVFFSFYNSKRYSQIPSTQDTEQPIDRSLMKKTTLGLTQLSKKSNAKVVKIRKKITKTKFIGAFVGVQDNQVRVTSKNGFANVRLQNPFKLDSVFFVGDYQDILNDAMIFKLADSKSLKLKQSLDYYLPKIRNGKTTTIRQLVMNDTDFYISKKKYAKYLKNGAQINLMELHTTKGKKDIQVNQYVKSLLISKVTGETYKVAVQQLLASPLKLDNTQVRTRGSSGANDVQSYAYADLRGEPVQSKYINQENLYRDHYLIQMSLADIVRTVNKLGQSDYIAAKYVDDYRESVSNVTGVKMDASQFRFSGNSFGQTIDIISNFKSSKFVVVVTNFPNKSISPTELSEQVYKLLN